KLGLISARRQLLAIDDFIVRETVEILDPGDLVITTAFIEPDRWCVAFLRRRFDQEHAPALPPDLILDETQQELADSLALLLRIDRDPVEVENTVGVRRRPIADIALYHSFRTRSGLLENVNDVVALGRIVVGFVDELHGVAHFDVGEAR